MSDVRLHLRNGSDPIKFLCDNKRDFVVEKTSSGFSTIVINKKRLYVREYRQNYGTLNNIMNFQKKVRGSSLSQFIQEIPDKEVEEESEAIEKTILYKGFNFDPKSEVEFSNVIKIDLNSAYWQTCRFMELIDNDLYNKVSQKCVKSTRLMMAGTLGKTVMVTEYQKGVKVKSYVKERDNPRVVQHNIYNRIRKFVDELMIWAWQKNPSNFIGYYVDCIWFREIDDEVFELLNKIYNLKIEIVDLVVKSNAHSKAIVIEIGQDEKKPYDVQFRSNEFVKYQTLYNFTPDLQGININQRWQKPQIMSKVSEVKPKKTHKRQKISKSKV